MYIYVCSNDVSLVTYQVSCVNVASCIIELLNAPSNVVLEKELSKVGKTLYSKAEPVEEEKKVRNSKILLFMPSASINWGYIVFAMSVFLSFCWSADNLNIYRP